jgi:plastocyanin domain-containing protein
VTTRFSALVVVLLAVASGCKKEPSAAPTPSGSARQIELKVTEEGFVPADVKVRKGEPLSLKVTRTTDKTCATEILIEGTDINIPLPLNQAVAVAYTPTRSGEIRYGCAMGMMVSGVLVVE